MRKNEKQTTGTGIAVICNWVVTWWLSRNLPSELTCARAGARRRPDRTGYKIRWLHCQQSFVWALEMANWFYTLFFFAPWISIGKEKTTLSSHNFCCLNIDLVHILLAYMLFPIRCRTWYLLRNPIYCLVFLLRCLLHEKGENRRRATQKKCSH